METSPTHIVLLPSYNTGSRLLGVVTEVLRYWQPVMVVIDGSTDGSEQPVLALAKNDPRLSVLVLPENSGKGAAVLAGFAVARERGFTHALVMDSDGQHPVTGIGEFMEMSRRNPGAMVLGRPIFGPDVPLERLYGRKLSVAFAQLSTLGPAIADPLYGFRVYPVQPLLDVLGPRRGGRRYDFDTDVAVRLVWSGVEPINLPSPVKYFTKAEGGVSHFHYLRDNLTLIRMHATLLLELLVRWPSLLRHRRRWKARQALGRDVSPLAMDAAR